MLWVLRTYDYFSVPRTKKLRKGLQILARIPIFCRATCRADDETVSHVPLIYEPSNVNDY